MFKKPSITAPTPPANAAIQASFASQGASKLPRKRLGSSALSPVTGASSVTQGRPSLLGGS